MARDRDRDYDDAADDDDFEPRGRGRGDGAPLTGMDGFLNNIAVAIGLTLFGICCCPIASLVVGGIGLGTCKNPDSKRNAMIVLVGGIIGIILNIGLLATGQFNALQNR
jgi:hypothetical protein